MTAESIFRAHGRDVLRIVRRLVGPEASEADVDDLVQQVFVAVHRDLPRFRRQSAVTTWLYGIASRTVLMHFRSGRRRARAMEAFTEAARLETAPPRDPAARMILDEELRAVWRGLAAMSPKKRVVFVLAEVEGLSGREIAEALDIKEATVWSRLFHARQELAEHLKREGRP
ncbi:MAG: RNA polymerase sigma factor [Myxococcota bacterium]